MTKKKNNTLSRRAFMKKAGLTAATIPLFNILKWNRAEAATGVAPLRLIVISHPFQIPELYYHPKNSAGGLAAAGSLSGMNINFANSILSPMSPFLSKMLIFRGLGYGQTGINSHQSNASCFSGSTASNFSADGTPATIKGNSIEQYLFSRMAQTGSLDPMVVGVQSYQWSDHNFDKAISWRNGIAQGMVSDPQKLLTTYFGNIKSAASSSGSVSAAAAQISARRLQALKVSQNGLASLLSQLAPTTTSGQNLTAHQSAVNGLVYQLSSSASSGSTLGSCSVPKLASIPADPSGDNGSINNGLLLSDVQSFSTLISEAFACDVTRFASFKLSDESDGCQNSLAIVSQVENMNIPTTFYGAGSNTWHAMGTHGVAANGTIQDQYLAAYKRFWFRQVAVLLTTLQSIADPYSPAQSLFDNTVVLIGSEGGIQPSQSLGGDDHNNGKHDLPLIVTGGCGGMFSMGRLIDTRSQGNVCSLSGGIAMNALLTNIINAFENNQKAFNPAFTTKILNQFGDYSFPVSATQWLA